MVGAVLDHRLVGHSPRAGQRGKVAQRFGEACRVSALPVDHTDVHGHAGDVVVADRAAPTDRGGDDAEVEALGLPGFEQSCRQVTDLEVVDHVVPIDDIEDEPGIGLDLITSGVMSYQA